MGEQGSPSAPRIRRDEGQPPIPRGAARSPEALVSLLADLSADARALTQAYPDAYEAAYGLSGKGTRQTPTSGSQLAPAVSSGFDSSVEAAVISAARGKAAASVINASRQAAAARRQIRAALRSIEYALGLSDRATDEIEEAARRRKGGSGWR